jgi:4-hydroxybenzoyl-CoA reductase subunit beta
MLRLPPFRYHRPHTVEEAVGLLAEFGEGALPVSGGTDLIPNMKHRLFTPEHLVALKGVGEMQGIGLEGGWLVIGAAETLTSVAESPLVQGELPALSLAAGHVAGPQLRNQGTLGGNVSLDTRCTYYNQTEFWRRALGYCLKKDGEVCHVTRVGKKCVAAHSADTPPVLMTVDARVELAGPEGRRVLPLRDFFVADGIWNTGREPGEIITRILIPIGGVAGEGNGGGGRGGAGTPAGPAQADLSRGAERASHTSGASLPPPPEIPPGTRRTAYAKLRQRKSVDFPLLTVAVAAWLDGGGRVTEIRGVVTGLGSRPRELTGWDDIAVGEALDEAVVEALAERAGKQCVPLENIIVDPEWRRAMVPVYVRRALEQLRGTGASEAKGGGPATVPALPRE